MKSALLLLATAVIIGVAAIVLMWRGCHAPRTFHVYLVANSGTAEKHVPRHALETYVKRNLSCVAPRIHFTDAEAVLPDIPSLLARLTSAADHDTNGPHLVLPEGPSSRSKKALREAIETRFSGAQRAQVLRAIVPVFRLRGAGPMPPCAQLANDVVYADDNFGGIGLVLDPPALETLKGCMEPR